MSRVATLEELEDFFGEDSIEDCIHREFCLDQEIDNTVCSHDWKTFYFFSGQEYKSCSKCDMKWEDYEEITKKKFNRVWMAGKMPIDL